jgi:tRNA (mo5U34)-methyltransferase
VAGTDVREAVDRLGFWYHTIDLMPGVTTPGALDHRPVVDAMPWPDLRGKRCLDIGTYDGFFAFEMERRGAEEVVATDISDETQWDWPPAERAAGIAAMQRERAPKGAGFDLARTTLGSSVQKREISIYDLDPDVIGQFDVVFCGALLLHLRDPLRALDAVRRVCRGQFISAESVHAWLTLAHPRQPAVAFDIGRGPRQWWVPNAIAHREMLTGAGFEIEAVSRVFAVPFGSSYSLSPRRGGWARRHAFMTRVLTRSRGAPTQAVRARPLPSP